MTKAEAPQQRQSRAPASEPARTEGLAVESAPSARIGQLQALADSGPPRRRHAAHAEMARNRTGLPDDLKQGVEALSGLSMDDVRVHYNSARPAQLQALAYAQGREIHLGAGQEHHLPHEAWHIVQQAQGRVRPTLQMKSGVAVNDDAALEREADVMGMRALQLTRAEAGTGASRPGTGMLADSGTAPIQRIATQVTLGDNNTLSVRIVGRPPNTYGSSAGDHLTAFATRQATLVMGLGGRNVWEALAALDAMIGGLLELPGVESIAAMAPDRRMRLIHAWHQLQTLRQTLPSPMELVRIAPAQGMSAFQMSQLQDLISTYLEVAELIPLSTINVAAKSKGLAGKGKGESSSLALLRETELRLSQQGSKGVEEEEDGDALFDAFVGVFDASAAGLVAAELDASLLAEMGVVFPIGSDPPQRMVRMIKHHLVTMSQSFPHVVARLGDWDVIGNRLFGIVFARMREQWAHTLVALDKAIRLAQSRIFDAKAAIVVLAGNATRQRANKQAEIERERALIADAAAQKKQIGIYLERYKPKEEGSGKEAPTRPVRRVLKRREVMDVDTSSTEEATARRKRGHQEMLGDTPDDASEEEEDLDESFDDEEVASSDGGTVAGPAVQIRVGKSGNIVEIRFAGRSPSPLIGGGMGAHTTAWVVYLDRIRTALVGQPLDGVAGILDALWTEATDGAVDMASAFQSVDTVIGEQQRAAATSRVNDILGLMATSTNPSVLMSLLQIALREMLNFQNNVPGATLEAADTGGKSEGKHRGVLQGVERGLAFPKTRIRDAIFGLLDLKVLSEGRRGGARSLAARAHHLELIAQAYPRANAIYTGRPPTASRSETPTTPPDLSGFDAWHFEPNMLRGEDISMSIVGPMPEHEDAQLDVNADYQYEDVDMYRILQAEVANLGLDNVAVVPPVDNMHAGQLTQRLRGVGAVHPGPGQTATLLVPFNIGNYHWVGIMIVVSGGDGSGDGSGGATTIVRYLDPLGGMRSMAPEVLAEIRAVFPHATQESAHRVLQIDGTSCGPLTIENLLMQLHGLAPRGDVRASPAYTERLRERHIRLLEEVQPGANFRQRQRNGNVIGSSFDMAGYLSRRITFTKRGTARILRIAQAVRGLSEPARTPIVAAFRAILAAEQPSADVGGHYALLRQGFETARAAAADTDAPSFQSLMREFWGTDDPDANFAGLRFADYEEMRAIGRYVIGDTDFDDALLDIEASIAEDDDALEDLKKMPVPKGTGEPI